jgi:hypothetical protein
MAKAIKAMKADEGHEGLQANEEKMAVMKRWVIKSAANPGDEGRTISLEAKAMKAMKAEKAMNKAMKACKPMKKMAVMKRWVIKSAADPGDEGRIISFEEIRRRRCEMGDQQRKAGLTYSKADFDLEGSLLVFLTNADLLHAYHRHERLWNMCNDGMRHIVARRHFKMQGLIHDELEKREGWRRSEGHEGCEGHEGHEGCVRR